MNYFYGFVGDLILSTYGGEIVRGVVGEWGAQLRSCRRRRSMATNVAATLCILLLEPPRRLEQV
jgi:hypothetical protein